MCKIPREKKKEEAIKRMKKLGLFHPCIKAFESRDEVQMSERTGLYEFSDNAELNAKIKEVEEEYNALVYHVIYTSTDFGELYSLLFVSDYEEEWEMDNEDVEVGYAIAYVWNKTVEYMSEMGGIAVRELFGGLVRVG